MMGKVRSALFDMLLALSSPNGAQFPATARWLDLYAGKGFSGVGDLGSLTFLDLGSFNKACGTKPAVRACRPQAHPGVLTWS